MTTYSTGKKAYAISDRSGQRFKYDEMVTEWNGSFVHYTEYEPKQPQLEPKVPGNDPQGLQNARPDRVEPASIVALPNNPFKTTSGSSTIVVNEPGHEREGGDKLYFTGALAGNGISLTPLSTTKGYSITIVNSDSYSFNVSSGTASTSGFFGGFSVSANPAQVSLPADPFVITTGSSTIQVNQPNHDKVTGDTVRFRNVDVLNNFGTASGFTQSVLQTSSGYSITIVNLNNYTFNASSGTASVSGTIGGGELTAETI